MKRKVTPIMLQTTTFSKILFRVSTLLGLIFLFPIQIYDVEIAFAINLK
jgi:hypothetical protein